MSNTGHSDIYIGNCLDVLKTLPAESVQCVVTSPPYYGLRSYIDADSPDKGLEIGLESTPDEYVANIVAVFREVRRVLRDDGTVFLNLGDSYASSGTGGNNNGRSASTLKNDGRPENGRLHSLELEKAAGMQLPQLDHGLQPKQLLGIPWRVAFALQADGWWLRSDIIWSKPNPMPESVTDRPTKAHEYIFLLSKSAKYFFDSDAIREGVAETRIVQDSNVSDKLRVFFNNLHLETGATAVEIAIGLAASVFDLSQGKHNLGLFSFNSQIGKDSANELAGLEIPNGPVVGGATAQATAFSNGDIPAKEFLYECYSLWVTLPDGDKLKEAWRLTFLHIGLIDADGNTTISVDDTSDVSKLMGVHDKQYTTSHTLSQNPNTGRNRRSVWTIATQPFRESHFATMPPDLVEPCIKAGTSERGCCPECGAPWERVTQKTGRIVAGHGITKVIDDMHDMHSMRENGTRHGSTSAFTTGEKWNRETTGWRPTCDHDCEPVPCTVLDPFGGAGTTALVANRLGRDAVIIELNPDYAELARVRLIDDAPMFASVEVAQ